MNISTLPNLFGVQYTSVQARIISICSQVAPARPLVCPQGKSEMQSQADGEALPWRFVEGGLWSLLGFVHPFLLALWREHAAMIHRCDAKRHPTSHGKEWHRMPPFGLHQAEKALSEVELVYCREVSTPKLAFLESAKGLPWSKETDLPPGEERAIKRSPREN
ncbi:hypothetical protein GOP47_0013043 [Adiantum capillus-veneris]|uniref:Uncharacterized protein n=1 Tax=Adiantum capillus-veneris TaxID=13818 RepID=A0A9D4ZG97_ADICA|nr:hypothetical protein GOP47_0013043 [Adiantum capillus-veneris]